MTFSFSSKKKLIFTDLNIENIHPKNLKIFFEDFNTLRILGKPCGHLVVYPRTDENNEKKKQNAIITASSESPVSSNEVEMLPMRTPSQASQRNLNRVSQQPQACESGDEGSP